MRVSTVLGSGRRQCFFVWVVDLGYGKRRGRGPWFPKALTPPPCGAAYRNCKINPNLFNGLLRDVDTVKSLMVQGLSTTETSTELGFEEEDSFTDLCHRLRVE